VGQRQDPGSSPRDIVIVRGMRGEVSLATAGRRRRLQPSRARRSDRVGQFKTQRRGYRRSAVSMLDVLTMATIHQRLVSEPGLDASVASLRR
jgi:hypothetical protein